MTKTTWKQLDAKIDERHTGEAGSSTASISRDHALSSGITAKELKRKIREIGLQAAADYLDSIGIK